MIRDAADYRWANETLIEKAHRGEVIVDIGHISLANARFLNREVRAGRLAKWRGYWFPHPGAPWGIGPLKTCWGLPAICASYGGVN